MKALVAMKAQAGMGAALLAQRSADLAGSGAGEVSPLPANGDELGNGTGEDAETAANVALLSAALK